MDLAPLFKHVRRRIPDKQTPPYSEMISRLEKVAREVIEHQLTIISDSGMVERGDALQKVNTLQEYIAFGSRTVADPGVPPGTGVSRVCLSMDSNDGVRHFRQFRLEIIHHDSVSREVTVRLYVSRLLSAANCTRANLDQVQNREIDTSFSVGLFDFPMIDNTHLTHGERCAVSLSQMTVDAVQVALSYFPGSRASLKDKPYYDDLVHDLIKEPHAESR